MSLKQNFSKSYLENKMKTSILGEGTKNKWDCGKTTGSYHGWWLLLLQKGKEGLAPGENPGSSPGLSWKIWAAWAGWGPKSKAEARESSCQSQEGEMWWGLLVIVPH